MQINNSHANNEAHGFSWKERIVQNISLALSVADIEPIRAMDTTKKRKMYSMCVGRLMEVRRGVMIVFIVATVLQIAYIFIVGTLESRMDEISYRFQGLSRTDCNFQRLLRP